MLNLVLLIVDDNLRESDRGTLLTFEQAHRPS